MKCLNREEIQYYLDREMPEEQWQPIRLHLSECDACKALYRQAEKEVSILKNMGAMRIESLNRKPVPAFVYPIRKRPVFGRLAVACVTTGIVVICSLFYQQSRQSADKNLAVDTSIPVPSTPLNEFPPEELDPNQQFQRGYMKLNINIATSN